MDVIQKRPWVVVKRIGGFLGTLLLLFFVFKFAIYFMPFFVAGLIALLIEPIIKFCMNKFKLSRRTSSIIIITFTIVLIISLVVYGGIFAVNEIIKISKDIGPLISDISGTLENEFDEIALKLSEYIPKDVIDTITNSIIEFLGNTSLYIQNFLGKILEFVLSVPTILLNVIVTILALIFFTKDRIYLIDMLEHHFPKKWIKNISQIAREIFLTLGDYIKVYGKIMIITFAELFLAFSILSAIGFEINNVFIIAFITAIVDILPILGIGTILIPWIAWQFVIGNMKFGVALTIVYLIILTVRQLIEPKLVSKQLGVHPLITLFAMYTGFKLFGFTGLILGPIILMILQCVFSKQIEKGIFKNLFGDVA